MKCLQCGAKLKTKREAYLYDREGIKVTLVNTPVHRCSGCGDFEVEIPRIEELHRTIVDAIIRRRARLSGAEIRFLRKSLGWSGGDFARRMGVDPATVSRWENGAQDIGQVAERLLRLLVSVAGPVQGYSLDDLADWAGAPETDAPPIRLARSSRGWKPVAA
jgi:putative zinc finger/helix-turn-helix YgiT family protein